MLRILLIRPGSTDFDEQGRIKGKLDMPLNENGGHQVAQTIDELAGYDIEQIYSSPCQSAMQTASALAARHDLKVKPVDKLCNLDHGLWQGKLIEEVRRHQPKVYRQWQDNPDSVCPPGGETIESAKKRVANTLNRLLKKHRDGNIAIVVPEPLASLVRNHLDASEVGNLWKVECDNGGWEVIDMQPPKLVTQNP